MMPSIPNNNAVYFAF